MGSQTETSITSFSWIDGSNLFIPEIMFTKYLSLNMHTSHTSCPFKERCHLKTVASLAGNWTAHVSLRKPPHGHWLCSHTVWQSMFFTCLWHGVCGVIAMVTWHSASVLCLSVNHLVTTEAFHCHWLDLGHTSSFPSMASVLSRWMKTRQRMNMFVFRDLFWPWRPPPDHSLPAKTW